MLSAPEDVAGAFEALGGVPCVLEQRIALRRELSILAVRGRDGATACYPLVQNTHREGILRVSLAPAADVDGAPAAGRRVRSPHPRRAGVRRACWRWSCSWTTLTGALLANEIAPRVHNSGHWTIEGAETSQFENHLRAILGLPLGSTAPRGHSAMVNLIGTVPPTEEILAIPGAHLHLYGKAPRPGRKLGHVTVTADTPAARDALLERVLAVVDEREA